MSLRGPLHVMYEFWVQGAFLLHQLPCSFRSGQEQTQKPVNLNGLGLGSRDQGLRAMKQIRNLRKPEKRKSQMPTSCKPEYENSTILNLPPLSIACNSLTPLAFLCLLGCGDYGAYQRPITLSMAMIFTTTFPKPCKPLSPIPEPSPEPSTGACFKQRCANNLRIWN